MPPRASPKRARRRLGAGVIAFAALSVVVVRSGPAVANGAFPDSLQLLLPPDRPNQIVLSTNFGLIISDDSGATWTWTCETQQTVDGYLYAVGAAPKDRFFALAGSSLAYSDDASCSWILSRPSEPTYMLDYFPDPADPGRVLAIGQSVGNAASGPVHLLASSDGGATFGAPLFTAPSGAKITAVESARSDPNTVYLALVTADGLTRVMRSLDAGALWTALDVDPGLGALDIRIAAVDPEDSRKVYVRLIAAGGEGLAISLDGGETFSRPIWIPNGKLKAFVRLASGTILVAGAVGTAPVGFRSGDGGAHFAEWSGIPLVAALAERDGLLFAAANNYESRWGMAVSADEGATFVPLGTYQSVGAVRECARQHCSGACRYEAELGVWSTSVCGSGGTGGVVVPPKEREAHSGCQVAPSAHPSRAWPIFPLGVITLGLLSLRRRSGTRRR